MRPGERCVQHCLHLCTASLVVAVISVVVGPGVV